MESLFYGQSACLGRPVCYYLLWQETEPKGYGVQILYNGELKTIPAISTRMERVTALLERMVRCAVTPVNALEVVEDWLLA